MRSLRRNFAYWYAYVISEEKIAPINLRAANYPLKNFGIPWSLGKENGRKSGKKRKIRVVEWLWPRENMVYVRTYVGMRSLLIKRAAFTINRGYCM